MAAVEQPGDARPEPALQATDVKVVFGGLTALHGVDLRVDLGEVVAIIGPNGAGKTTLLNAICGLVPKTSGEVRHYGKDVTNAHPTKIAQCGVGRSFQDPRLIDSLSVLENVLCGAHATIGYSLADQVIHRLKVG